MLKSETEMIFLKGFSPCAEMYITAYISMNTDLLLRLCTLAGVLFLAVFLVFLYIALKKRKKLLELQRQQYDQLIEYTAMMERLYENIQSQKHDFLNILFAIKGYVEGQQWKEFKRLYQSIVNDYAQSRLEGFLNSLNRIEHPGLKGILGYKLSHAQTLGLNIRLDIATPITIRRIDPLVLCRIVGILTDNAIEAAAESREKEIHIAMESDGLYTSIIISNTYGQKPDLSHIGKRGYSTKGEKRGIGLHNVKQLLAHTPSITLKTTLENDMLFQELIFSNSIRAV